MRALTVLQPFATALCRDGMKRVENRNRDWPRTIPLPAWVAIHAGARMFPDEDAGGSALLHLAVWGDRMPVAGDPWREDLRRTAAALPMRRVVGAVRFVRSVSVVDWDHDDPWASGPYCWVRDLCVEIEDAPEIRGSLGLWSLNGYMDLAPIREAIAAKYGADEAVAP